MKKIYGCMTSHLLPLASMGHYRFYPCKSVLRKTFFAVFLLLAAEPLFASFAGKIRQGNREYKKNNYDAAAELYREAELKKPSSPLVHYNLGNALYKQENYEDALSEYQKALSEKDKIKKSKVLYNIGNTYYRLGKIDEAIENYKKTLKNNPEDEDARYNLRYLLKLKQQPKEDKKRREKKESQQKEKSDGQDKEKQQQEKGMSKQDIDRLLEMSKSQEKEALKKRMKPVLPKIPQPEEDW